MHDRGRGPSTSTPDKTSTCEPDFDAEHDHDRAMRVSGALLRRIQRKAASAGSQDTAAVHASAQQGVASPSVSLPFGDKIQQSFGEAHDVSKIQAHVGGDTADAMGATAYATGNHVVFDRQPDLHTAAHEAAHVVQQARGVNLYGGVGEAGDHYERHADEVADRVVSGQSAADLLGGSTRGAGGGGGASSSVQREAKKAVEPQTVQQVDEKAQGDSYDATTLAIELVASQIHDVMSELKRIMAAPEDEGGVWKKLDQIRLQISIGTKAMIRVRQSVGRFEMVPGQKVSDALGKLYGNANSFAIQMILANNMARSANNRAGINDDLGRDYQPASVLADVSAMYSHFGIEMKGAHTDAADPAKDHGDLEQESIVASFTAMNANVDAMNAHLDNGVATGIRADVQQLIAATQQVLTFLQSAAGARVRITPKFQKAVQRLRDLSNKVRSVPDLKTQFEAGGFDWMVGELAKYVRP